MLKKDKIILVTGASGSGGSYMLEELAKTSATLYGLVRNSEKINTSIHQKLKSAVQFVFCDLNNFENLATLLAEIDADEIYHFASNANVSDSFIQPREILNNNINCALNLFEVCRQLNKKPKILLCSTSEVYGQVQSHETPISELNMLRPASPYAVSKTTQDLLARVYWDAYQLPIIRGRMFTYINPRRRNLFATSFAVQVAQIERGQQNVLKHGNLNSVRTHLDIRDAIQAYIELMRHGQPGEAYNLGGLNPFTVGEFLQKLILKAKCPIKIELDEKLLRPTDVTLQIPDVSKFSKISNWQPTHSLDDSIDFLLEECRTQVAT